MDSLKIKSFNEILINMAKWVADKSTRLIDFTEGSIIRMLLEAVATELEEYYFKTYQNIIYAMDNAVYDAFGFEKEGATYSKGYLQVSLSSITTKDTILPVGTMFTTGNNLETMLTFVTFYEYTIPTGTEVFTIEVVCTTAGEEGNVLANTVTSMLHPIANVRQVTNPDAFISGKNEETSAERRARFMKYVESRSRGTKTAIEYGTMEVEGVAGCYVNDVVGAVYVYCHDVYGYLPDSLKEDVEENLEEYRCAGVPLYVQTPVRTKLSLSLNVYVDPLYNTTELQDEIELIVTNFLNTYGLGEDVILSDVNSLVRDYEPIIIKNCRINTTNDIEVQKHEIIRAGTVEVNLFDYED